MMNAIVVRGFYILAAAMLAQNIQHIDSSTVRRAYSDGEEDPTITYVKIKPLVVSDRRAYHHGSVRNLEPSSRIEHLPLVIRGGGDDEDLHRLARPTRQALSTDYADRDNESEARFDTSEAEDDDDDDELVAAAESRTKNELALPDRPKTTDYVKKYYSSDSSQAVSYRKYLETRRFRSRCRCERIWNCPKLQISVPRCPDEYFLCCF